MGILTSRRVFHNNGDNYRFHFLSKIPETGDLSGKGEILLKKYLWSSFFTYRYENSAASHAARELTWMIYLNDVPPEAGGETEFMYQHKRFNPTAGTVMIFPAGMTHVHRGNTVLDGDKYILTGWYIKSGA